MVQAILAIHLLTALVIIGLILMQQGKGAEAGASFGAGASQTLFGSSGSWNFFSRMTAIFAAIFFVTSITLAVIAKNSAVVDDAYLPAVEEIELPVSAGEMEIPTTDSAESAGEIPVIQQEAADAAVEVMERDEVDSVPVSKEGLYFPEDSGSERNQ